MNPGDFAALHAEVTAELERAHRTWGDYTASGLAAHLMDRARSVMDAPVQEAPACAEPSPVPQAEGVGGADTPPPTPPTPPDTGMCTCGHPVGEHDSDGDGACTADAGWDEERKHWRTCACAGYESCAPRLALVPIESGLSPTFSRPTSVLLASVDGDAAIWQAGSGPATVPCGSVWTDLPRALEHVSGCVRCLSLLGWDQ